MKLKRSIFALTLALLSCSLLSACGEETGKREEEPEAQKTEYEVSVSGECDWDGRQTVKLFDLSGNLVATCDVSEGKAVFELDEGSYIAQLSGAPVTVSFCPLLLTPKERSGDIRLKDSALDEEYHAYRFDVLGLIFFGGALAEGYEITVCYEPESGAGFCHLPQISDASGAVRVNTVKGNYHITANEAGQLETLSEYRCTLSEEKRFFLFNLNV